MLCTDGSNTRCVRATKLSSARELQLESEKAWARLSLLTRLERLDISFSDLSEASAHVLTVLTGLTSLDMDSTYLPARSMCHLQALSHLRSLNLADN